MKNKLKQQTKLKQLQQNKTKTKNWKTNKQQLKQNMKQLNNKKNVVVATAWARPPGAKRAGTAHTTRRRQHIPPPKHHAHYDLVFLFIRLSKWSSNHTQSHF